jgi:hypothetical protein
MDTETVLAQILPGVEQILKAMVEGVASAAGSAAGSLTLYALEEQVRAVLAQVGHLVLQGLVDGQGSGAVGPERACACGGVQHYQDQARPLSVQTSLGVVQVRRRAAYRCAQCGARSYPLDGRLGLKGAGRMSRYLQEQVSWLYSLESGQWVQQALVRFGWPELCVSQIRAHAQGLGAELETREQAQQAAARQEAGQPAAQQGVPRQPTEGERLYAGPDGVMYCTTTQDPQTGALQWRELKVAAVYTAIPESAPAPAPASGQAEARARAGVRARLGQWWQAAHPEVADDLAPADRASQVTYVVETGPWQAFGGRLWAELWARGLGRPVDDLAVVADGSDHIDQVVDAQLRLPGVRLVRILDLAHAQQHFWAASRAAFGEGDSAGVRWAQPPLAQLERGDVDALLASLEQLAAERAATGNAEAAAAVRREAAYFAARRAQLDYPTFVAAGYQIGSGLAESACKRFGTERMKGAGMRWTVPGAQATATLRMLLLSNRWEEVSTYCRMAA